MKAKNPWIALLDSDDQWAPQKLERQINHLSQNPSCLALHTGEKWIRNGKEINSPASLDKSEDGLWKRSLEKCMICPSSVLLHQSIFEKIGTFDPAYPFVKTTILASSAPYLWINLIDEPLVYNGAIQISCPCPYGDLTVPRQSLEDFHLKT